MSFLDNSDHLAAVAGEWGNTPETLTVLIALVRAALADGNEGGDDCAEWIVERGYATRLDNGGLRITDAGRARAAA